MVSRIVLAPEAEQDLLEAYDWYEKRRPGLGEEFLSCVDACLERIRRTPEMHAKVHEDFRRAIIRRFPYVFSMSTTKTR
jgi:plasmid stabilization system protein ParE